MLDRLNHKKTKSVMFCTVWVFLCCYFMQLFNFPNVLTILLGGSICLVLLIKQKCFRLDVGTILLTLTIASYFIIMYGKRAFTMSLPYVGVLIYVLANYLTCEVKESTENHEKYYVLLLYAIVAGYSLHGIINSFLFLDGQLQEGNVRLWMDIWENWYLPGTWQVIFFLPALSFVFPALVYFKNHKSVNILIFAASALFVYIALASKTRTPILAFPIVFCAQIVLYALLEREKVFKIAKNKKVHITAVIVFVIAIVAIILLKDHPAMASFKEVMGRDGGILNNIRFKLHREGLRQLFIYPMGGYQMDFLGHAHAHNTWIDVADAAGVIPFFCFAAYTFVTIYELICWLLKKDITSERKLMVAGLYGIFFLYYTVERGLGGSMHYMTPWFFINAMVHAELSMMRKNKKSKI